MEMRGGIEGKNKRRSRGDRVGVRVVEMEQGRSREFCYLRPEAAGKGFCHQLEGLV